MTHPGFWIALVGLWVAGALAALPSTLSIFSQLQVRTSYSALLTQKNAQQDSLLPALDGDAAFAELLRRQPQLWSISRLDREGELMTRLEVDVIYIDGIREEASCEILPQNGVDASRWNLRIGLDLISGGSSVAAVHVRQCLDMARDQLGYSIRRGKEIVQVPPKAVLDEAARSQIPQRLDPVLQERVLQTHRYVERTGTCPADIRAYAVLLDVWNDVKDVEMDLELIDSRLNAQRNSDARITSCAFSREWNQRYSEEASLNCDPSRNRCVYTQSEDGTTRWELYPADNSLVYQRRNFAFISWGAKSVREGGTMMDLRLIPLSNQVFLEAYINREGVPVSLGLVTVGRTAISP